MAYIARTAALLIAALAVLAIGGCASQAASAPQAPQFPSEGAQLPAQTGPIPVEVGKPFDVTANDGTTVVAQATFTKFEINPTCSTKYGTIPKAKGTYIAIAMDFATTATYTTYALGYPTGYDFSVIGPDGYTQAATDVSNSCLADREQFNAPFSPSSKYRGWLLIDSPSATGSLIFKPHFSTQLSGWKIAIPG